MPSNPDEFYVGYLPRAPAGIGRRTRMAVLLSFVIGVGVALALLAGQSAFAPSHFEFGVVREFRGVVRTVPYPTLMVERPGAAVANGFSQYLLVAFGKHGASELVSGLDGRAVTLEGSLIYRKGHTMIEIVAGSVAPLSDSAAAALQARATTGEVDLGAVTLTGEIVDTKCFWGVMKPGNLKPHRACATRCISGGVPPALLVRDAAGQVTQFLLVGANGEPVNRQVLTMVAEPIEVSGRAARMGDLLVLYADPATYRRL